MRLFIAEKPQLGAVIAEALGGGTRKSGYIDCGRDAVTWCIGHLLELSPPEAHNPDYAKWNAEHLPLKIRPVKYQPIERTADQLAVVGELIARASEIVHAGDPDEEGQLLVDEVLDYFGNRSPVKRILISDLNTKAAQKALGELRDNREFHGLSERGRARSIADQLYGFNMTRAYSLAASAKGMKGVLSVGRVQTPILGLIVNRYLANKHHKDAYFHTLSATMDMGGDPIKTRLDLKALANTPPAGVDPTPALDDKGRIHDQAFALDIVSACTGQAAQVVSASVVEKEKSAPLPFALLDLQGVASDELGLSSQATLDITQQLREKYKAITYNRSDCGYMSTEQFDQAQETIALLAKSFAALQHADWFADVDPSRKSRAVDDSKVTAHTAIIPTPTLVDLNQMSKNERNVYALIVRQYLIQFLPPKRFDSASVVFDVAGHRFNASATQLRDPGWSSLVKDATTDTESDAGDEEDQGTEAASSGQFERLQAMAKGEVGTCQKVEAERKKTRPLPLYTEKTLLADLRRVARYIRDPALRALLVDRDDGKQQEHGGIGTPSTRAAMLETLRNRNFYTVESKKFVPTPLGISFIQLLPPIATSPDMTALWHEQQKKIEAGELSVDAFLDELDGFIVHQVANVELGDIQFQREGVASVLALKCPQCCGDLVRTPKLVACKACEFRLFPVIAEKALTDGQIEQLLAKGKTGVIKGFKSKAGSAFEAMLRLDRATGKVTFEFPPKKPAKGTQKAASRR
ncbi:type IA DNA topoisomerase [Pseudomonas sp. Q1-7]|uniref:type IA DNA topoisomerase n=1 Tax=Pseudomonas sp. Q1-7 TaxID=3020843 RepID=UPI0023019488|nr:type IA DNA topoisomerase [Pseudomonas sp. Q1-7]